MRASSMGINYEAMTAKAAEMLAESQSKAGAGAGAQRPAADAVMEDAKPVKSAAAGETRITFVDSLIVGNESRRYVAGTGDTP